MAEEDRIIGNRWKIVKALTSDSGQGRTFTVLENHESSTVVHVLKLLKRQDEQALARFRQEIQASFALKHPNIVKAVDAKFEEGVKEPYLVTTFCEGGELTANVVGGMPIFKRLEMFRTICEAIEFAHSKGIIHRDIKPRNIFLTSKKDGVPVIGDFGLCFFEDPDPNADRLTLVREQVGARDFRPPEADQGLVPDMKPSFDVYSLGKLLYWFISGGRIPPREYYDRPQHDLRAEIADPWIHGIHDIFKRSIAEDPSDRYEDTTQLIEDVNSVIQFVDKDARFLDCNVPQDCIFCRNGKYVFTLAPKRIGAKLDYSRIRRLAIYMPDDQGNVTDYNGVLAAQCDNCGNVQHFRFDYKQTMGGTYKPITPWRSLPEES